MRFPHVFVAGTFEGLHKGHAFFLSKAFSVGERVTIGLTSNQFVKKFKISNFNLKIREYEERKENLQRWLKAKGYARRSSIVPIHDPYEPASSFPQKGALLVTPDNKHRGEEINIIRKKSGLPPLTLIEVPLVKAQDLQPISSTRMRKGEIDGEGRLILPDNLRPQLQQPLGLVLHDEMIACSLSEHRKNILITVGDVATKTLLDAGVVPSLMIIDNKVERKPYRGLAKWRKTVLAKTHKVKSGPGYIAQDAVKLIRQWSRQGVMKGGRKAFVIEVDGEEDLLTLPAITEVPIGSVIYYGQPPIAAWARLPSLGGEATGGQACGPVVSGLVEIEVTDDVQRQTEKILTQFER